VEYNVGAAFAFRARFANFWSTACLPILVNFNGLGF